MEKDKIKETEAFQWNKFLISEKNCNDIWLLLTFYCASLYFLFSCTFQIRFF